MEDKKMRTLVRTNRMFPEMPSVFDEFLRGSLMEEDKGNFNNRGTVPAVNTFENNDAFALEVAAPGMKKEDFKIELDNNTLTISSEQEENKEIKENEYSRREFRYHSFTRSFQLPENKVDSSKITAKYADGILYVNIPKREEAKVQPTRMIEIA